MDPGERPLIVVDAANVMGSRPDGWWRDRPGAARRLLGELEAGSGEDVETTVVLEGAARAAAPERDGQVRVVHAHGSGDDAIVELVGVTVSKAPDRRVVVVTADRELRARVAELGADARGPRWLWNRIGTQ